MSEERITTLEEEVASLTNLILGLSDVVGKVIAAGMKDQETIRANAIVTLDLRERIEAIDVYLGIEGEG